jgi:hypothetical protein
MTTGPVPTSSSTAAPKATPQPDFIKNLEALSKSGGSFGAKGAVYTNKDADADVQAVYQQVLGRNAGGNEYAKAVTIAMGLGPDSGAAARQQAILNFVQNTPEFAARQDNNYLDAIYNAIAADVSKTQVQR